MGCEMKISYKKLWIELIKRDLKKSDLRKLTGLSAGTITKLNKNEPVSIAVLLSICEVLNCDIGDICSAIPNDVATEDKF
jgi:DNA-binding Xre family transcriptional regulator